MEVTLTAIFAVLGAAIGSFLNVVIDRVPARRSLVSPPSFCDGCRRRLAPRDLVPVLSFIWLRRRCRHCGAPIPWRVFWVESGTAVLFAFLYWHLGPTAELAVAAVYSCAFIVIFAMDLEHRLILNRVVFPVAVATLLANVFRPDIEFLMGLAGGGAGFALLLLPALIFRGGMGFGDVKMAGLIGLVVGFPEVFVAIFGAIIAGGVVAAALVALRLRGRKDAVPFGPFLSVSAMVTILFGGEIMDWYLALFR